MTTHTQKQAAQAIVNLFETGSVRGDYGKVTLLPGDPGHLTYGRSQTTLASGNLGVLLQRYCDAPGARFGKLLAPWLERCLAKDLALDHDARLKNLLRAAADDPVMRDTQDLFFDDTYWAPATRAASKAGFVLPLSHAVTFDSFVHGSWKPMSARTIERVGQPSQANEKKWITTYLQVRREWLATHKNPLLRQTVYRQDCFLRLIEHGLWNLELPFVTRSQEISETTLTGLPPNCYAGPAPGSRALGVQSPILKGLDVRLLQLGLSEAGCDVVADGLFGRGSVAAIREFQSKRGLPQTGAASIDFILELTAPFA